MDGKKCSVNVKYRDFNIFHPNEQGEMASTHGSIPGLKAQMNRVAQINRVGWQVHMGAFQDLRHK